jgi:N-methylhydantoinase A
MLTTTTGQEPTSPVRIGVDVGGTFTDFVVAAGNSGNLHALKVPSTPDNPTSGILAGLKDLISSGLVQPAGVDFLGHGTTVATNALLEGRGGKVALITTQGFSDVLEIARQQRPHVYDWQILKPPPLVPRKLCWEVPERIAASGEVIRPLDIASAEQVLIELAQAGIEALAICLLNSYKNTEHEDALEGLARDLIPECYLSVSHDILPEFREYERTATTVANAYLGPLFERYIKEFAGVTREIGITGHLYMMQSNGGVISPEGAERFPVRLVLSGPSAGVTGATYLAQLAGYENLVTFDMGGTSTDVSLVDRGTPMITTERTFNYLPIKVPTVDIHTVGAGGGSYAWIDTGGHLKVGPSSAGAVPGPVCYGKGGTRVTVTDANLYLRRLHPASALGGELPLYPELTAQAIEELAQRIGLTPIDTALGIVALVNFHMVQAIHLVSVQRGFDPRDYTLIAFGGAGPMHAAEVARQLSIGTVMVPPSPGVLSALGLLVADLRMDFVRTDIGTLNPRHMSRIRSVFDVLDRKAIKWFSNEGIPDERQEHFFSLDMRYRGQGYELSVPILRSALEGNGEKLAEAFDAVHRQVYGYAVEREERELVNMRVTAIGKTAKPMIRQAAPGDANARSALIETRQAVMNKTGRFESCPVYDRLRLQAGARVKGPAIIEQMDATTVLHTGDAGQVDRYRNLIIKVDTV